MISAKALGYLKTTEDSIFEHLDEDVRTIFATMVGVDLSRAMKANTSATLKDCITSMVGIAGTFNGVVSINIPRTLSKTIASQMLGLEITEVNEDVFDALGEIANMVGGSFKHHFETEGHQVNLSVPSVISGNEYVMSVGPSTDTLSIMFEYNQENFIVNFFTEMVN